MSVTVGSFVLIFGFRPLKNSCDEPETSPITISIKLSLKLSHCSIFLVLNSFPIFKGVCWNPLKHPHYKILHNKTFLVKICDFAMHSFLLITPSSNLLRNHNETISKTVLLILLLAIVIIVVCIVLWEWKYHNLIIQSDFQNS
jgi:hypothetical protein